MHRLQIGSLAALALLLPVPLLAQGAGSATPAAAPSDAARPATDNAPDESAAIHAQATFVVQGNAPFRARLAGPNSLARGGETRETADVTVYLGAKPWRGAEVWVNPEIDQGFGLANTLGAAGFPSGEAYKVGKANPYIRVQRYFIRQTFDLGGDTEKVAADLNVLGGHRRADRLVLTVGKVSVGDIFDTNAYAHDPRGDFLNWALLDAGSFDYAADAWGYTTGGAAELYLGRIALRAGIFNLSTIPNTESLEGNFRQYQLIGEGEFRYRLGDRDGKVKLTGYVSHGNMARLDDAVAYGRANGTVPDPVPVRRFQSRPGVSVNLEQAVSDDLGVFARAGWADGAFEAYEFTDIDRSYSLGASLKGGRWGRPDDRVGVALVVDQASPARLRFLAAGGLGILIGDGALPHAGDERIVEGYYDFAVRRAANVSFDVQVIGNPAYNRDRGPVAVFAGRLHAQF